MKQAKTLSLIAAALFLAGCGDDSSSTTTTSEYESYIQDALARDTKIDFTLQGSNASVPLPSFALMNTSDGTLEIPTGGDTSGTNPRVAMGTMDGWSTSMPLVMTFKGTGFSDGTVPSGIYLIELSDSMTGNPGVKNVLTQNVDFVAVASSTSSSINIVPLKDLNGSSEYILAITDSVTDSSGEPVGTSSSYAALKSSSKTYTSGSLASAQKVTQGVEAIFQAAGIDSTTIVYSTWFSTQSIGETFFAVRGATALGLSSGGIDTVWKDAANPNNVDLSGAYVMSFESPQDYVTAIDADTSFDKYVDPDGSKKPGIKGLYAISTANVTVTKGHVKLPHYLETGANWNTQSMQAAMPSLALISNALNDSAEKATVGAQLIAAGIDTSTLATDVNEQLKLVGQTLTKSDGSQLDPERIMTRYAPVPQIKSLESVEFLLFTKTGSTPTDVVIYQHGITSAKENAYAFAFNLAEAGIAVLAIDMPLHGSRSLDDQRSANADVLAYLNLSNLAVARDNLRQSVLDVLGLRASLVVSLQAGALSTSPLQAYNVGTGSKVKMLGHSLGGIVATSAVAAASRTLGSADAYYSFSAASIQNSGGQIANLLAGSSNFGPQIKHTLAGTASTYYQAFAGANCDSDKPKECYELFETLADAATLAALEGGFSQFFYAAQTVLDTVDPYTNASYIVESGSLPLLMAQVIDDETVPNSVANAPFAGTQPLAAKLGLATVNASTPVSVPDASFIELNSTATHSTFVAPQQQDSSDAAHYIQMQTSNASFIVAEALPAIADTSTLK